MLDKLKTAWKAFKLLAPLAGVLSVVGRFLPFGGAVGKLFEGAAAFLAPLFGLLGKALAWAVERFVKAVQISLRNFSAFAVAYTVVFAFGLYMAGVWNLHGVISKDAYQSLLSDNDDLYRENAKLREQAGKPARVKGPGAKRYQARTAPSPGELQRRAMGGN